MERSLRVFAASDAAAPMQSDDVTVTSNDAGLPLSGTRAHLQAWYGCDGRGGIPLHEAPSGCLLSDLSMPVGSRQDVRAEWTIVFTEAWRWRQGPELRQQLRP
ncbi:hypothetical protein EMCRGX_G032657 [Ephydatia muelleri]